MTFSVIVPVYKSEKYLAKCLDSLLAQTCSDFEIIVVNDGSPDRSQSIIDDYSARYPEKLKSFIKENGGVSHARNYAIERSSGEYLVFVDSDDYIAPNTLEKLYEEICANKPDVIGYGLVSVSEAGEHICNFPKPIFSGISGEDALITLVDANQAFEAVCGFACRREYWLAKGFAFMKGIYHEDFALIPLVILRAEKVSSIDFAAYYYVSTEGSIMRSQTQENIRKRAEGLLKGFDFLVDELHKKPAQKAYAGKLCLAYATNSALFRLKTLKGEVKAWFRRELIAREVSKYLINDSLKRKIRKILLRLQYRI